MGKFATLEKAHLTKDWGLEERSALAHFLKEHKVSEKDPIFKSKSEERRLYIIESGQVRLAYENTEVDLGEGDSFAELSIVHSNQKLSGAIALTNCVFWILPLEKWEDMKRAAPIVSLKLIESICQKMAQLLNNNFQPHRALNGPKISGNASQARAPQPF